MIVHVEVPGESSWNTARNNESQKGDRVQYTEINSFHLYTQQRVRDCKGQMAPFTAANKVTGMFNKE